MCNKLGVIYLMSRFQDMRQANKLTENASKLQSLSSKTGNIYVKHVNLADVIEFKVRRFVFHVASNFVRQPYTGT